MTTQPKFQGLKSIPMSCCSPADWPSDGPGTRAGMGLSHLRMLTYPCPAGWAGWAQRATLSCVAISLLWVEWAMHLTTQQVRLTFSPTAVGFLEHWGEHVPREANSKSLFCHIAIVLLAKTNHLPSSGSAYRRW